mgnify:FL=1
MALNVGHDFTQRWLQTPEVVRQTYMDDLARICDLLQPDTDLDQWIRHDEKAQLRAQHVTRLAYDELKEQLREEARQRHQMALEHALAEKRSMQQQYAQQLLEDEKNQYIEQTQWLIQQRDVIQKQTLAYTSNYHINPQLPTVDYGNGRLFSVPDHQIQSELESVRLRLELEADLHIEQLVIGFRKKLQANAREEIRYILEKSHYSSEKKKS